MRRNRRRYKTQNQNLYIDNRSKEIVELWILRILLPLNGHREFIDSMRGFSEDSIAYFLGLDKFIDEYDEKDKKEIFQIMRNRLQTLEESDAPKFPKTLKHNLHSETLLL